MADRTVRTQERFQPEGWPRVAMRIVTPDPPGLAAFLRDVFEARGEVSPGIPGLPAMTGPVA